MKKIHFKKISVKFTFIIALIIFLTMSLSTVIYIYGMITNEKNNLLNQSQIYSEIIGNFITSNFLENNINYAELNITNEIMVVKNPDLKYVELYNVVNYSTDDNIERVSYYYTGEIKPVNINIKNILNSNFNESYININSKYIDILKIYNYYGTDVALIRLGYTTKFLNQRITNIIIKNIVITVILILLGVITGIIFSKKIVKPINHLSEIANKIAAGNLNLKSTVKTADEIESLSNSFNKMTEKLKNKINDLQALQKLSVQLSSLLEKEQLLTLVMKTFIETLNIYKCGIFIFNHKLKGFELMSGKGLEMQFIKNFILPEKNEINNYISKKGVNIIDLKPTKLSELFYDTEKLKLYSKIPSLISPLMVQNTLTGFVIVTEKITGIPFLNDEIKMFEALANQTAIAIENARLYELAITDELTKVFMCRYFRYQLEIEINHSLKNDKPLALLMIDIDHFKQFNDNYGHLAGDKVLYETAQKIKNSVRQIDIKYLERKSDVVARYGGEEFAVILPETNKNGALSVSERIRKSVENNTVIYNGKELKITISIGASVFSEEMGLNDFIESADKALYYAKKSGRNKVSIYK